MNPTPGDDRTVDLTVPVLLAVVAILLAVFAARALTGPLLHATPEGIAAVALGAFTLYRARQEKP